MGGGLKRDVIFMRIICVTKGEGLSDIRLNTVIFKQSPSVMRALSKYMIS